MIDREAYHGGAQRRTTVGPHQLHRASPVVQQFSVGRSLFNIDVRLPDPTTDRPAFERPQHGFKFYIVADIGTTRPIELKYWNGSSFTTLVTINGGNAAKVWYTGRPDDPYRYRLLPLNTPRPAHLAQYAGVPESTAPKTYNANCFFGDPCVRALEQDGLVPLDGEHEFPPESGWFPVAVLPLFQDPMTALNLEREAIRAADIVMPSHVAVVFRDGEFEVDPAHPEYAGDLSEEFYAALFRDGTYHILEWDNNETLTLYNGESRHWHHIRLKGGPLAWSMPTGGGGLTVQRWVWRKVIPYGPADDPERFNLEVRFVVEHTVSPHPVVTPPGGGSNDSEDGAWGALCNIYVFTDEIKPGFSDGGTYTPAGGSDPVAFTKNDPCAWGSANGVAGGSESDKFCHPQLAIAANLVTSFQSPLGSNYVPLEDREKVGGRSGSLSERGRNREYCYTVGNGAPWSGVTCNTGAVAISDDNGRIGNIVFKGSGGATDGYAGMTRGGDVPRSEVSQFVTIENGSPTGRTYLTPKDAGWDEDCGQLSDRSSIGFSLCVGDDYAEGGWPRFEVHACEGHPDEPFAGVGGTHRAFHTNSAGVLLSTCCPSISTSARVTARAVNACQVDETVFGDRVGGSCSVVSTSCREAGKFERSVVLRVEDYTFVAGGNQDNRMISWKYLEQDPDYDPFDYEYDSSDISDFSQESGSWTFNAGDITVSSLGSGSPLGILLYDPTGPTYEDYRIITTVESGEDQRHGIGVRMSTSGTPKQLSGFSADVEGSAGPPYTLTFRLSQWDSGVETVLASKSVSAEVSDVLLTVTAWGSEIAATFEVDGNSHTLRADSCSYSSGPPGLVAGGSVNGHAFSGLVFNVRDDTRVFEEVAATFEQDGPILSFPIKLQAGYGKCDRSYPSDCGSCCSPAKCNCTHYAETLHSRTSSQLIGEPEPCDPSLPEDGDNPTYRGGPAPPCCEIAPGCADQQKYSCGDCPRAFVALSLDVTARTPLEDVDESPVCGGLDHWAWNNLTCI